MTKLDPDRRAELEQERDFLMRSLDDLELERDSGGIDGESYAQLHDDYTARAAAVIRTLRDGVDVVPAAPKPSRQVVRRRVMLVTAVVVFAVLAGVSLAYALGARLPGGTSSGNAQVQEPNNAAAKALKKKIETLQRQVNANPNDYQLRLDLSRAYEENGDFVNALQQSDAAVTIDGNRPEGLANSGRLLFLVSEQLPSASARQDFIQKSLDRLSKAIDVGAGYADAYYFRGVLYTYMKDNARAQIDFQNYLLKAPNGTWASQARTLLAQVTNALAPPTTTTPKNK